MVQVLRKKLLSSKATKIVCDLLKIFTIKSNYYLGAFLVKQLYAVMKEAYFWSALVYGCDPFDVLYFKAWHSKHMLVF